MEEFHLTVLAPPGLSSCAYDAIRQILASARFRASLRRAARKVFGRHPELDPARVKLTL
jgi:hypothetical protein